MTGWNWPLRVWLCCRTEPESKTNTGPSGNGTAAALTSMSVCLLVLASACVWGGRPALAQVTETVLHSFTSGTDGGYPYGGVIVGDDGDVYGTTGYGGTYPFGFCGHGLGNGTVFKLTPRGNGRSAWTESVLWSFSGGQDGCQPQVPPFAFNYNNAQKKTLWGTTVLAGKYGAGTVFKLTDGRLSTLWPFTGATDGSEPIGQLAADKWGALYGTTTGGGASGNGTVFKIDPVTGTLTTIWSFSGSDGSSPQGNLLIDDIGAIYGTTASGGLENTSNSACYTNGCGTVFKMTPSTHGHSSWTLTTLYYFTGGADGSIPAGPYGSGGVVADKSGALYGTTFQGGTFGSICDSFGCGVVFKLAPPSRGHTSWTETVIWSFSGFADGDSGNAPLVLDRVGALYGAAQYGGQFPAGLACSGFGCGVVFKLTPPPSGQTSWTETTLWAFSGQSDGQSPYGGIVADKKGALYGTTQNGGTFDTSDCPDGCGVVFKLDGRGFAPGTGN